MNSLVQPFSVQVKRPIQRDLFFLVLVLLLATATRLHGLGVRSLWEDEGWTLVLAKGPTVTDIVQRMAFDQHPPLYFIAIHFWRDLAGSTEFALRVLSVLTGLMAVAGIYQLGRAMYGRITGLMAAFLLALSDHHIDLSQDVRHYAQLATLLILSCWYYFRFIQNDYPIRGTRFGYVLTSIALLYSHYLGGFVLLCQGIHAVIFVRPWRRLRWLLFHFGAAFLAFSPWFIVMIRQNQVRWVTPLYYLNSLPNSHRTYIMVREALLGKQYAISLVLLGLGLVWLTCQKDRLLVRLKPSSPVIFVLLWVVGYIVITVYFNEEKPFLTVRNFIVVTPGIILLASHGLANLQTGIRNFMMGVLLVISITTVDTRQLKVPWREVFQTVTEYHNPDEPVLMDIWVGDFPGRYYIEQQMGAQTPWLSVREARDEYVTQFLPVLLAYIRDRDAFWIVYWQSVPIDESDYAGIFRQAGFQRSATFSLLHARSHINVYRYDRMTNAVVAQYCDGDTVLFTLRKYEIRQDRSEVSVQLLWFAEAPLPVDYSISVFLLDSAGLSVVSHDSQPQDGNAPTTQWSLYQPVFDEHRLHLANGLHPGEYTLGVKIYYYQRPDTPLQTPCSSGTTRQDWAVLGQLALR